MLEGTLKWVGLETLHPSPNFEMVHTAISRKVVGKSARDNPKRHCGWF